MRILVILFAGVWQRGICYPFMLDFGEGEQECSGMESEDMARGSWGEKRTTANSCKG